MKLAQIFLASAVWALTCGPQMAVAGTPGESLDSGGGVEAGNPTDLVRRFECQAQNLRGDIFTGRGATQAIAADRAMRHCQRNSARCVLISCRAF